nr:hypothetical protein [Tanacetum cinerariifolium]
DPKALDVVPMKRKALSLHWELMFTRSLYETPDMIAQHELLNRVAELIDQGVLKTTLGEHFGAINAANLRRAHAVIESGKARGKIVLEVQRQRLALHRYDVERFRIIDQCQLALRLEGFDELSEVGVGVRQAGDVAHLADANLLQLLHQWLAVVDDVMSAQALDPLAGFRARCGADHGQIGQLTRQLYQDRSDATAGADDQQAFTFATALLDTQPIEEQFPGGDRGQRQCGGVGVVEGFWLVPDDALIDQVEFAVAPRAGNGACVEHFIAHLEQRHFIAGFANHTDSVPSDHFGFGGSRAGANFGIDRIHRNRSDFDQQITGTGCRLGQVHVDQRIGIFDGQAVLGEGNGFHGGLSEWDEMGLASFSNAAREVDLLPGQVAAAIKRLERELDIRLFARSTRSLRLTAEGEQYLPTAQTVLDALKDGREKLRRESAELQGTLQVAAPSDLGRNLLLPWLTEFRSQHPALSLRLFISDQVADLFRDPVDVAIRYGVDDADLVRRWAVAGQGVAYKSWLDVCEDVRAGRLELLLPDYPGEPTPLNLVCPHRKQFSPAVQQLHSLLRNRFAEMEKGLPVLL